MRVLVTGGAGFIGSHLVDALVAKGHNVTVIDSLEEQVHGDWKQKREKRATNPIFRRGFCGASPTISIAHYYKPFDVVFHLAAVVGVGQSQSEIARYMQRNVQDTADMLQFWTNNEEYRPQRLIVASSMSIYGEGRRLEGVTEEQCPTLPNQYALTKYAQEIACLNWGDAYGVATTALRFFNTYGERQSLSNPYTGVAAMFAARLLHGKGGIVYQDGRQTRDFVHVSDIVQGLLLAMTAKPDIIHGEAFNIGTGEARSLQELHRLLENALDVDIAPIITGSKRKGDINHCFADISKASKWLGYYPRVSLCDGIRTYAQWLRTQDVTQVLDRLDQAQAELQAKGLLK